MTKSARPGKPQNGTRTPRSTQRTRTRGGLRGRGKPRGGHGRVAGPVSAAGPA